MFKNDVELTCIKQKNSNIVSKEELEKLCEIGTYANTDGEWCLCGDIETFKKFLESKGFVIDSCVRENGCSAKATTNNGLEFCYNGYCSKKK